MSRKSKLRIFSSGNIKSIEKYYKKKSLSGYHLAEGGLFLSDFTESVPCDFEYSVVYNDKNAMVLNEFLEAGWTQIPTTVSYIAIFRKENKTITENDKKLKSTQYKQCAKLNFRGLIVVFAILVIEIVFIILKIDFGKHDLFFLRLLLFFVVLKDYFKHKTAMH